MSDRPRGTTSTRSRGPSSRGAHSSTTSSHQQPKKEAILDLTKYTSKRITVRFAGGREVTGTLVGHDQLLNLVLDDARETLEDGDGNKAGRLLGLVVTRGTLLTSLAPVEGSAEIEDPWREKEEGDGEGEE